MKSYRAAYAPLVSVFLIMLANGFFTTFLSVRLNMVGHSVNLVGWLGGVYFLGIFLGGVRVHFLVQRVGHIRAFAAFASILGATMMAMGFYFDSVFWMGLRLLGGFCCAGVFVVAESWLVLLGNAASRGKLLSLYMISLYGGQGLGQLFLRYLDPLSIYPFCVSAMIASLSIVPVCVMRSAAPVILSSSHLSLRKLYRISPLGLIGSLVAGLLVGPCYALAPAWLQEQGFTSAYIAYAMSGIILGGLAFQWPIGLLSDVIERRKVLGILSFISAVLSALIVLWVPQSSDTLVMTLAVWGGFLFTLYPVSITISSDHFNQEGGLVALMGGLIVAFGVGSIIGPLVTPFMMSSFPRSGFFLYMAIVSTSLGVYALWRRTRSPDVPEEERVPFLPVPRTTTAVGALDPRGDNDVVV